MATTTDTKLRTQLPASLHDLVRYLDGLTGRASMDRLDAELRALDLAPGDLDPWTNFDAGGYQRNVVCEGTWYQMLLLCWGTGQRSPIHDHARSVCGFRVMGGTCTETIFERTPAGYIKPTTTVDYAEGEIVVSSDADIHQVANLCGPEQRLATLHIYSPALTAVSTYDLDTNAITRLNLSDENCWGAGI